MNNYYERMPLNHASDSESREGHFSILQVLRYREGRESPRNLTAPDGEITQFQFY